MSLPHTLLGLLRYSPMTGYQLKKVFDDSINFFWAAQMSQIYRELNNMEKKGWLASKTEHQEGKPDRRVYNVTPQGHQAFLDWLNQFPDNLTNQVRNEFLARIFFASQLPLEDLAKQILRYRNEVAENLSLLQGVRNNIQQYKDQVDEKEAFFWRLTMMNGFRHMHAALQWADECLVIISEQIKKREVAEGRQNEDSSL